MDGHVRPGDAIVCRVNGTVDWYVVGTVVSGEVGELSIRAVSTTAGRESAIRRAYRGAGDRVRDWKVWLFDGAASGYVKTTVPPGMPA